MLLRKLSRACGASSQIQRVFKMPLIIRRFSSQKINSQFQEFLSGLNKKPEETQKKEKIKVKASFFQKQESDDKVPNTEELQFLRESRGHKIRNQSNPLQFQAADGKSNSETEFKSEKKEEIHPQAYYKQQNLSKFKQEVEDSINFQNSEQGKQFQEFKEVLKQRSEKIQEYTNQMLRRLKRPFSQKDKFIQRLEGVRQLVIELTAPRFGEKRFFAKEQLKHFRDLQGLMKECVQQIKFDPSEVKEYPGSSRGPNPQDDPDHYEAWWEKNKPSVCKHPLYYELMEKLEKKETLFQELLNHLKDQNQELKNFRKSITKEEIEVAEATTKQSISTISTIFTGGDPGADSPGTMTRTHEDMTIFRRKPMSKRQYEELTPQEKKKPEQPDVFEFASWRGSFEESPLKFDLGLDTQMNNVKFAKWAHVDSRNSLKDFVECMELIQRMNDLNNPLNYHEEVSIDPQTGHKVVQRIPRKIILTETLQALKRKKPNPGFITGGYYELLPSNIRSHILVRNTAVACEFHHSQKSHREKELMLNLVASLILPVKKEYQELMIENLAAKLPQFNEERAREMMMELEKQDFDSDSDQIFDDDLHQDYIELDFPQENYELHFEKWQQRERLRGIKMVYDDLEKDQNGDFVGMPKGWRPSVYSPQNLEFIEKPLQFTDLELGNQEDDEPSTEELIRAGELASQKMEDLGMNILDVSSSDSSSEDEDEIVNKEKEKLMKAGYGYLKKYRTQAKSQEEQHEKFKLKEHVQTSHQELDFPIMPIKNPLVPEAPEVATPPIDFYDNEDGFWDEYIAEKRKKNFKGMEINFFPFFKH